VLTPRHWSKCSGPHWHHRQRGGLSAWEGDSEGGNGTGKRKEGKEETETGRGVVFGRKPL